MPQIFISHSTKDCTFIEKELLPVLRRYHITCWYAPTDIKAAEHWDRSMREGLEKCDWFLVVMSTHSAASEWVTREVHWAMAERQNHIIPVLIEACDTRAWPVGFERIQRVDFRTDKKVARRKLLEVWGLDGQQCITILENQVIDADNSNVGSEDDVNDNSVVVKSASEHDTGLMVETGTIPIELVLNRDYNTFSSADEASLLAAIAALLKLSQGNLQVSSKRPGSVRLTLELTPEQAERLLWAAKAGELAEFGVIDAEIIKWGFVTDIEQETIPRGLNEDIVRFISAKKHEPDWLLDWRLKAYRYWAKLEKTEAEPTWANVHYPPIDYQQIVYYSAPKTKDGPKSLEQVDPKLLETYEKLGIPLFEQKLLAGVAVDEVFNSVSVATTFKEKLAELGIIFCSFSEAVQEHPELVQKYLGSVVPYNDNFFASLNSAVFSDGSFCYVPKGVRCPMELSTYFRINAAQTGQFERTLIIADEGSYVSYLEGCTAPMRDENQLHAAVVELVALDNAQIKYSTVQNWYPGDKAGKGGIYNFVTKRGKCLGKNSKISWTQVETGSAITWKYPSCILQGDNSIGEFYSVALTNNYQQADTGTKMIHIGRNTKSTIISKGISAGHGQNTYRGMVKILKEATGARNYSQCDFLLIGDKCSTHTFPYLEVNNNSATVEHEASTSKISEDQLFYCRQRGISAEDAVSMIVGGFCKQVLRELPMEFAVEALKLLGVSLEGSVGEARRDRNPDVKRLAGEALVERTI